jgi:hypothetical protein
MATPLPAGVAASTGFIAIILAIPLHALLALDFTGTILDTFAFHSEFSFPKNYTINSIVVYFLLYAIPLDDMRMSLPGPPPFLSTNQPLRCPSNGWAAKFPTLRMASFATARAEGRKRESYIGSLS